MSARDGGESSRPPAATRENGDEASDERPLKKARFAWQVKGKYRLKQSEASEEPAPVASVTAPERASEVGSAGQVPASAEQNLEILGDYLLKQDLGLAETNSEDVLEAETKGAVARRLSASCDAPPSLVVRVRHTQEDRYLEAWQARQMAKGFVDNTINRVLDSWSAPRPRRLQRVAELADELPASASVEDEGIRAAISAHGLQHYRHNPLVQQEIITKVQRDRSESRECDSLDTVAGGAVCDATSPNTRLQSERPRFCCHTLRRDLASRAARPAPPSAHAPVPASAPELASFMDAAVAFAIQNKGLTSLGYEYG